MSGDPVSVELAVPATHLEQAQCLWIQRDNIATVVAQGYYFSVEQYDGEYCKIEIHGHADAPDGDSDE